MGIALQTAIQKVNYSILLVFSALQYHSEPQLNPIWCLGSFEVFS